LRRGINEDNRIRADRSEIEANAICTQPVRPAQLAKIVRGEALELPF
jgi:hypothetical protein